MESAHHTQQEQAQKAAPVALSRYSKRVLLRDIVGRNDGGAALAGQRVVVGGWVKSSRELKKDLPPPSPTNAVVLPAKSDPDVVGHRDVSCTEVLQSRIPFFKSILRALGGGGGDHRVRDKLDAVIQKLPQPTTSFLQLNDGSSVPSLQILVDSVLASPSLVMPIGTCILAEGVLQEPSEALKRKHVIELKVERVLHVGAVDQDRYPLSKKRLPLEQLRDQSHFRPRTTTVASVTKIHSALTQATHVFCQNEGFFHVQVPVITSMDTEGSGKLFQVTTLLNPHKGRDHNASNRVDGVRLETIKSSLKEKSNQVEELKRSGSNPEAAAAAVQDLKKTAELVAQLEAKEKAKSGRSFKAEKVNFSEDFFASPAYLTVSGRLHLESYACAMGNVYTLGPRFRAEQSESKTSLSEMWMLETEMAFSQLEDAMDCAGDFLKFVCKWILENCNEDLKFVSKRIDKTVEERLSLIISTSFEKISYSSAVEVLKQVTQKKFHAQVEYGAPLTDEHQSYLVDVVYKRPVIIYNHPKQLEPFYTRQNDDGRTVSSFVVILPKVGAVIRGSQNEERLNVLSARMKDSGLMKEECEWYLDLRRNGTAKNSGFSAALELLVLYATGLNDVKDVVSFPRSYGRALH